MMGTGRWSLAPSPSAHFLLCSPIPNSPQPGSWRPRFRFLATAFIFTSPHSLAYPRDAMLVLICYPAGSAQLDRVPFQSLLLTFRTMITLIPQASGQWEGHSNCQKDQSQLHTQRQKKWPPDGTAGPGNPL